MSVTSEEITMLPEAVPTNSPIQEQIIEGIETALPRAVPTDSPIQEQVIEGIETAFTDVHSPLDNNPQEAVQSSYTRNIQRPRAATTMDPIEEEAIEDASMTEAKDVLNGLANSNEEAARQEERQHRNNQRAAMTADLIEYDEYAEKPLKPTMDEVLKRSESLIANAPQHEHSQDEPACTDNHHNKNCGRGIDMALMEYSHLRSKGLISERSYEHWGCDSTERIDRNTYIEKLHVRVAFRPVNWDSGYTGRGMTKRAMEQHDDIGPMGEVEPSNASPLQMQMQRRRQTPKVLRECTEEGNQPRRSDFLDGDGVGPFGESLEDQDVGPCNEATPPHRVTYALKMSTQDIDGLLTETARADWELLERQTNHDRGQKPSETHGEDVSRRNELKNKDPIVKGTPGAPISAAGTPKTTDSQRKKRRREPTEDSGHEESKLDERVPRCKRLRTSGSNRDKVRGSSENGLRQQPHNNRPSERVRNLLNTMSTIDTGALDQQQGITYDGSVIKREHDIDDDAEDINVRPTYAKQDFEEEGNDAEEIVVMKIERLDPRPVTLVKHREWTCKELELLRLWVQDYGIKSWTKIAWCLKRSKHDCKTMCRYLIMAQNRWAGRELQAGMPKDLLPPPASPLPLTSPTITARTLKPRTRQAPKFQCGDIVYNAQARSLPKLAPNGTVVDNKGDVILSWPEEVALALKKSQPRRKAGQTMRLTERPQTEDEQEVAQASEPRRRTKLRLLVKPRE